MNEYTITANITFKVQADSTDAAAVTAYELISEPASLCEPENILVWDEEPDHWFAERYTYANPPVHIIHTPVTATEAPIPTDNLKLETAAKAFETEATEGVEVA